MVKWKTIPINVVIVETDEPIEEVPCGSCSQCCQLLTPFLTENEWKSGRYLYSFTTAPDFVDDRSLPTVAVQQKPGGGCVYFQDNRCSIYDDRPLACRQFDCRKGHHPKLANIVEEKFGINKY